MRTEVAQKIASPQNQYDYQAAFFKLANVIPYEDAEKYLKEAVVKSYGKKGEKVVQMNYEAIDNAVSSLHKVNVPASWADTDATCLTHEEDDAPAFVKEVLRPMNAQAGDQLPVSTFVGRENGQFPQGTAAYEKRCIAVDVPKWKVDSCIQCNQCSMVCPHAAIRPFLLTKEEVAAAPKVLKASRRSEKALKNTPLKFRFPS
jgi:pyruvate-ferredoxin/flavodoxin oxidoreductase